MLKSNKKVEEKPKKPKKESVAPVSKDAEEPEKEVLSEAETEALTNSEKKTEESGASMDKMKRAVAVASQQFNLGDTYNLNKFDDAGTKVKVSLSNEDFDIAVTIKSTIKFGLM